MSNADCCNPDKGHLYDCPFPDSLICAVGDGEAGACVGDSGGILKSLLAKIKREVGHE